MKPVKRLQSGLSLFTLMLLFSPLTGMASVCLTAFNPVFYDSSQLTADFNNDGINDRYLIVDDHSSISLSQNGIALSSTIGIIESWALDEGLFRSNSGIPTEIIGADVDNDGWTDIVAAFGSRIVIRKNTNNGSFSGAEQFLNLGTLYGINEAVISSAQTYYNAKPLLQDLNQDGYPDLLIVHSSGLSIFLNDTSGQFSHLKNVAIADIAQKVVDSVYLSDLNADSIPEIIISAQGSYVVTADSELNFSIMPIANHSDKLTPVDWDNDGDLDFVEQDKLPFCQIPTTPEFRHYWINQGNGEFKQELVSTAPTLIFNPAPIEVTPGPSTLTVSETETAAGSGSISLLLLAFLHGLLLISIFRHWHRT